MSFNKEKYLERNKQEQLERILLPDAPPIKRPPSKQLQPSSSSSLERPSRSPRSRHVNFDEEPGFEPENDDEALRLILDLLPEEDVSSEEDDELMTDVDGVVVMDSAHLELGVSHASLTKAETDWLTADDEESDRILSDLLPPDNLTFNWDKDPKAFKGQKEKFMGKAGPTFEMKEDVKPIDVFLKIFDEDLLDLLVIETNRFSKYLVGREFPPTSSLNFYKNSDRGEIAILLAVFIFLGLDPLFEEKEYWQENGYLTMKNFKSLMNYNRFVMLQKLLYFTSPLTKETDDIKLSKMMPLLNHLQRKFRELYQPSQDIIIDESLVNWDRRLDFAQSLAKKAANVGIKSYELCESSTGYLWNFFIYAGKEENPDRQTDKDKNDDDDLFTEDVSAELPPASDVTARIVYNLAKPLFGKGHTLVLDSFYNSPLLARYLKCNGTDCYGTIRLDRQFVPEAIRGLSETDLRPGEVVHSYCEDLSIMVWRRTKVSMLSTFHDGKIGGKEEFGHYKYKPQIALDYNLSMEGVNKKHQLLFTHPKDRSRKKRWYKKMFRRLLDVAVLNSLIIYRTTPGNSTISHYEFRRLLAEELVHTFKQDSVEYPIGGSPVSEKPVPSFRPILSGNHFIGMGTSENALCVWCRKSHTEYICMQCKASLCLLICFEEYHTKAD